MRNEVSRKFQGNRPVYTPKAKETACEDMVRDLLGWVPSKWNPDQYCLMPAFDELFP
jgi:hypothetical protein